MQDEDVTLCKRFQTLINEAFKTGRCKQDVGRKNFVQILKNSLNNFLGISVSITSSNFVVLFKNQSS